MVMEIKNERPNKQAGNLTGKTYTNKVKNEKKTVPKSKSKPSTKPKKKPVKIISWILTYSYRKPAPFGSVRHDFLKAKDGTRFSVEYETVTFKAPANFKYMPIAEKKAHLTSVVSTTILDDRWYNFWIENLTEGEIIK